MSQYNSPSRGPIASVAEFLADREGLAGTARERFRHLLQQYGGFSDRIHPRRALTPTLVALLLGGTGAVLDHPRGWSDALVWTLFGMLSAGLIWSVCLDETKRLCVNPETEWEAYRLFLRPVILSEHPGLLDRNAPTGLRKRGHLTADSSATIRALVYQRGPDFWRAILGGSWFGAGMLVVARQHVTRPDWLWLIAFPAAGFLLGFGAWLLWRRLVYFLIRSDSRVGNS